MSTYPITDSILKRHHEQLTGEISGGMIGDYPITDSILRRHDAQHSLSGGSTRVADSSATIASTNAAATATSNAAEASSVNETVSNTANAATQSSSPVGKIIMFVAALIVGYFLLRYFGGQ